MPEECFDNDRLRHRQVAGGRFALRALSRRQAARPPAGGMPARRRGGWASARVWSWGWREDWWMRGRVCSFCD